MFPMHFRCVTPVFIPKLQVSILFPLTVTVAVVLMPAFSKTVFFCASTSTVATGIAALVFFFCHCVFIFLWPKSRAGLI